MATLLILAIGVFSLMAGSVLGYFARQKVAKKQAQSLEATLDKRLREARKKAEDIVEKAEKKGRSIVKKAEKEERALKEQLLEKESFLRKKEDRLDKRGEQLSSKKEKIQAKVKKLKNAKEKIDELTQEAREKLEKVSHLSEEEAKEKLMSELEEKYEVEVLERIRKLEREGEEKYEARAKEILAGAIQRFALPQVQEITTSTLQLPSDDIKGRIIGKGGRNIKVLEKLTGTEVVVDDTPETVVISGFDPTRRQIAKLALKRLVDDGRIQPARIEKEVEKAQKDIKEQIKKAGEKAVFQTSILGLEPKLVQLLGRLHFRTSYGQNVLLHSIEVAELAGALADEIGADTELCKRAGLLHDIGKSMDRQVEGSHVEIGMRILKKLGESEDVIAAMKSHHGDYEPESLEAVLVQAADQISGARPGARKESLEEYLKRLENLEEVAQRFEGVKKSYAIQAGRELRVFVKPEEVSDLEAHKIARSIANRIEDEIKYPGKIKVTLIREQRVIEYAK